MTTNSDHYDHLGGFLEQDSAGKVDGLHHQLDQAWQPGAGQSIEVPLSNIFGSNGVVFINSKQSCAVLYSTTKVGNRHHNSTGMTSIFWMKFDCHVLVDTKGD